MFVDYKGGASSQVFERLPHTVGYVTNLSAELSLRALTSLRAELNRRMAIMEGRAKDLAEMLEVAPDEAPPSLVSISTSSRFLRSSAARRTFSKLPRKPGAP